MVLVEEPTHCLATDQTHSSTDRSLFVLLLGTVCNFAHPTSLLVMVCVCVCVCVCVKYDVCVFVHIAKSILAKLCQNV